MLTALWTSSFVIFLFMTGWWAYATLKRNMGLVDIAWGAGFVVVAINSYVRAGSEGSRPLLMVFLVALWGTRLASYLGLRNWGKPEDWRYQQFRESWGERTWYLSYPIVFLLQGFLMMLVSLPVMWTITNGSAALGFLDGLGMSIALAGLLFESLADAELARFKASPENSGKVCTIGPWRYSRHPNYFGEATFWLGLFLLALGTPWGWATFPGPLLIWFLLLRVSGVPMLESRYAKDSEYQDYAKTTPVFFPWFPKRRF